MAEVKRVVDTIMRDVSRLAPGTKMEFPEWGIRVERENWWFVYCEEKLHLSKAVNGVRFFVRDQVKKIMARGNNA